MCFLYDMVGMPLQKNLVSRVVVWQQQSWHEMIPPVCIYEVGQVSLCVAVPLIVAVALSFSPFLCGFGRIAV